MTDKQIGVGIIGVQSGRSWSAVAHIPALRSLPQYKLLALSTRRQDSADAAARAYAIEHAFDNHQALVSHPRSSTDRIQVCDSRAAYGAGVFPYHQSARRDKSARKSIRISSTVGRPTYHHPL